MLLSFLLALALGACEGTSSPATSVRPPTFDTISGTIVVRNPLGGQWGVGDSWSLIEKFRIGAIEDQSEEYLFRTAILGPIYGPHGQIWVQDFIGDEVTVYDGVGNFLHRFGGSGQGPADLRRPTAIGWDGRNRIWVGEPFNGRYSLFDSTGAFVETVRRPWIGTLNTTAALRVASDGSFIEAVIGDDIQYVRFDPESATADSLTALKKPPPPRQAGPIRSNNPEAYRPFINNYIERLRWTLSNDETVWTSLKGSLRLAQLDLSTGDTLRIVETSHRRVSLSSYDEGVIERGVAELRAARRDFPIIRPIVEAIHVLEDGHVLVLVVESTEMMTHAFDVFSPEGAFLGTLPLDFQVARRSRISSRGDELLLVTTDDMDVAYVVVAELVR